MSEQLVGGVCALRDARDLAPYLCRHYLRLGFDRLVFIDDGSSDGTYEFLRRLSERNRRVSVSRRESDRFDQARTMTEAVNALVAEGVTIVFPFDADEFWNLDLKAIRRVSQGRSEGLFLGKWVQFVQSHDADPHRNFRTGGVRFRAPSLAGSRKDATRPDLPEICAVKPKVAFKSGAPVVLAAGQHKMAEGPTEVIASDLEVFHLCLRHPGEIAKRNTHRIRYGRRREDLTEEKTEAIWRANSADAFGCLRLDDDRAIALIPDERLRTTLSRAWLYMALRHPQIILLPPFSRPR